jgi:hypothetical protein
MFDIRKHCMLKLDDEDDQQYQARMDYMKNDYRNFVNKCLSDPRNQLQ